MLTVSGLSSATTLSLTTSLITCGQSASLTANVSGSGATPTGSVTLATDGGSPQSTSLTGGSTNFTVSGLNAGSHTFGASYGGDANYTGSTSANMGLTVNQAPLTVTGSCSNRIFDTPNTCTAASVTGYQYTDSQATVFSGTPAATTTATEYRRPARIS